MSTNQTSIRPEFASHTLNDAGKVKTDEVARTFSRCLNEIEGLVALGDPRGPGGRELAIVKTHLEEAKMFATRAIAVQPINQ